MKKFLFRGIPALLVGAALLVASGGSAFAGGWSSYSSAFPALPCQDGWAACLVGGAPMSAAPLRDGAGHPVPADARIGWFDLAPTATFSPFTALSPYTGPIGGQVAEVEPPKQTRPAQVDPVEDAPVANTPTSAPSNPTPVNNTPPPTNYPPEPVAKNAPPPANNTPPPSNNMPPPKNTPAPVTNAPTPVNNTPPPPVAKNTPAPNMPPPSNPTNNPTTNPTAQTPVMIAPPTASTDDSCADLIKLEPLSMMGQLRPGQQKCIEGRISTEGAQTAKDKLSRILIANAESKGDKAEWERLMKRHLEDIDRSDPDMCFKYALQLSRGGVGRALGVVRWADYSLENKQKWSGQTYTSRVYNLYRLKAEAANKLWQDAENNYMTKDHTDENEATANKWRGTTKDYAREWLDYAKASNQDTKNPLAICVSAAGNKQFCDG